MKLIESVSATLFFMDAAKLEITANEEVIFGFYPDGKMLVKDEPDHVATARERLTAALELLRDYSEPPPRHRSS